MGRKRSPISGLCCVYSMTNSINGKVYVGATICLRGRVSAHITTMRNNIHCNPGVQSDYNEMGDVFKFEILQKCDEKDLLKFEEKFITELDTIKNGYNVYTASRLWFPDCTKEKMSKSHTGVRNINYGKHRSDETKKKISDKVKAFWARKRLQIA